MLRAAMSLSRETALGSNADWLLERRSKASLPWYCPLFLPRPLSIMRFQRCVSDIVNQKADDSKVLSNFSLTSSAVYILQFICLPLRGRAVKR